MAAAVDVGAAVALVAAVSVAFAAVTDCVAAEVAAASDCVVADVSGAAARYVDPHVFAVDSLKDMS